MWLCDDGAQINLGTVITSKPKDVLFNQACKMIVTAPYSFRVEKNQNIRKLIKSNDGPREHHFIDFGGNVLSIMEAHYVHRPD